MFVRAPETGSWKAPKSELCHTVHMWGEGVWPNNLRVLRNMDTHRTHSSEGLGSPCHRCQLQIIAVITECCDWSTIVSEAMFRNQWDLFSKGSTTDILWCLYGRWSVDHIKSNYSSAKRHTITVYLVTLHEKTRREAASSSFKWLGNHLHLRH